MQWHSDILKSNLRVQIIFLGLLYILYTTTIRTFGVNVIYTTKVFINILN